MDIWIIKENVNRVEWWLQWMVLLSIQTIVWFYKHSKFSLTSLNVHIESHSYIKIQRISSHEITKIDSLRTQYDPVHGCSLFSILWMLSTKQ